MPRKDRKNLPRNVEDSSKGCTVAKPIGTGWENDSNQPTLFTHLFYKLKARRDLLESRRDSCKSRCDVYKSRRDFKNQTSRIRKVRYRKRVYQPLPQSLSSGRIGVWLQWHHHLFISWKTGSSKGFPCIFPLFFTSHSFFFHFFSPSFPLFLSFSMLPHTLLLLLPTDSAQKGDYCFI